MPAIQFKNKPSLLWGLFLFLCSSSFSQTPPNILLIIGDDMGVDVLSRYSIGTNSPHTPTIDQLMDNGLTFTNVWAAPVCSPTRASILTGKYGINNGVTTVPGNLSTDQTSLFKEIAGRTNNAYKAAVVGKWHLSSRNDIDHPYEHGADDFMGVIGGAVDDYYQWSKVENNERSTSTDYVTSYFTDYALDWINDQTQPWLMWLAHVAPHTPYHTPPEGMYSQEPTNSRQQQYRAMVEAMDFEIGRLLESIPEETLNNTVIIFLGDNGTPNPILQTYPEGRGKSSVYQGGINVPMVISGTGVTRKNEQEDALINVSDLFATITHLADPGVGEEGLLNNSLSFKHLLDGSPGTERTHNFMSIDANEDTVPEDVYTVRNGQYKLIRFEEKDELYDLLSDPYELSDLLQTGPTAEQAAAKSELEGMLNSILGISSCNDGIQNGNETGVDCGGDCAPCEPDNSGSQGQYPVVHTGVNAFYDENSLLTEIPAQSDPLFWQDAGRVNNEPSYTDNGDGTITDKITGLMWEQDMGEKITYAEAIVKAENLEAGGHTDWRIPTIKELYSLILFSGQVGGETAITPFIDTDYFNQPIGDVSAGEREIDAQVWTNTHYTGLTGENDTLIFGVNFIDGRIKGYPKYTPRTGTPNEFYFRLVRGNMDYGKNLLVDNNDGTISDHATMLMWQQADDGVGRDWASALAYCEDLELGGHSDWHLPHAKELQSIVDYSRSPVATNSAAIDPVFSTSEILDAEGNSGQYPYFWASTTHLDGNNPYDGAVYVAFGKANGQINDELRDIHGAGAQRSDPKTGAPEDYPTFFGPQGDVQIVFNYCRCVRNVGDISTSSINRQQEEWKVYPNPVRDAFVLELPTSVTTGAHMSLYDLGGKLLVQEALQAGPNKVNVQSLPAGFYLLVISDGQLGRAAYRVVKTK
jgi:arylsulfatase A-like enzyme